MPWFFAYGLGTDPEQMRADIGEWSACLPATLADHVYTFTGYHPDFDGPTSTLLPMPGGVVLGAAYEIDERRLEEVRAHGHGYVMRENEATVQGERRPVLTLQPQEIGAPGTPSDEYLARVRRGLLHHHPAAAVGMYLDRALRRAAGPAAPPLRSPTPERVSREYNTEFHRIFPWERTRERPFGSAWATVAPGDATTPHAHDEEEAFVFVAGEGVMSVDGLRFPVRRGDTVYLEPFAAHTVLNTGSAPLELLCIWWGGIPAGPAAARPELVAAA
jgi:mannose-6-phosphate isomerase-like protein (cupin superfamily)